MACRELDSSTRFHSDGFKHLSYCVPYSSLCPCVQCRSFLSFHSICLSQSLDTRPCFSAGTPLWGHENVIGFDDTMFIEHCQEWRMVKLRVSPADSGFHFAARARVLHLFIHKEKATLLRDIQEVYDKVASSLRARKKVPMENLWWDDDPEDLRRELCYIYIYIYICINIYIYIYIYTFISKIYIYI